MGSNVIFTYVIVKQMNAPWQGALAMVACTGAVFLILSLTKLREKVAHEVPEALKIGIQAAVGTLIVFIGLRGAGFIVANPSTHIAMGSLKNPAVLLIMLGLLFTPILVVRKVQGALIIAIERPSADTTPAVTVDSNPKGLPIATTNWPRRRLFELPSEA
jgi:AGZA family xanthine/uracil permease-like MFS transporter